MNGGEMKTEEKAAIPRWLIVSTIAFTLMILAMAVAETNLWMHFLVDRGEYISVGGALFIGLVGIQLHRQNRLKASLPLFIPWLLYPVVTQGDQLIDNLTINQMRLVCHVILAIIFGAPVVVSVLAILHFVRRLTLRTTSMLVFGSLVVEAGVAYVFLGWYMIFTLGLMAAAYALWIAFFARRWQWNFSERHAFRVMLAGVAVSLALFFGFKNRPGAYQGSPAAYMDPAQKDAMYELSLIPAGKGSSTISTGSSAELSAVLAGYGEVLHRVVHAYWLMDRNYNYSFHNELFWRSTPIVPDFRATALDEIQRMRQLAVATDERAERLRMELAPGSPEEALVHEMREFTAYNLRRAATLEGMSAEFIKTRAGLQHATHLYEGEAKMVDVQLQALLDKHRSGLEVPVIAAVAGPFRDSCRQVHEMYGNRIVGF